MKSQPFHKQDRLLHWALILCLVLQAVLHGGAKAAFDGGQDSGVYHLTFGAVAHFAIGGCLMMLVLRRVTGGGRGARLVGGRISYWVIAGIEAVLLAMTGTGALAWVFGAKAAADLHAVLWLALLGLLAAHAALAIYGQYVARNNAINRITGWDEDPY